VWDSGLIDQFSQRETPQQLAAELENKFKSQIPHGSSAIDIDGLGYGRAIKSPSKSSMGDCRPRCRSRNRKKSNPVPSINASQIRCSSCTNNWEATMTWQWMLQFRNNSRGPVSGWPTCSTGLALKKLLRGCDAERMIHQRRNILRAFDRLLALPSSPSPSCQPRVASCPSRSLFSPSLD
jgi:hypothetical protein